MPQIYDINKKQSWEKSLYAAYITSSCYFAASSLRKSGNEIIQVIKDYIRDLSGGWIKKQKGNYTSSK